LTLNKVGLGDGSELTNMSEGYTLYESLAQFPKMSWTSWSAETSLIGLAALFKTESRLKPLRMGLCGIIIAEDAASEYMLGIDH